VQGRGATSAAADGEQDPEPVVGERPKASPDTLDLLDDRIEALGRAVRRACGVPGQDLAAPSFQGAGHASHLLGPGVPEVLDEAVDPMTGELGLAVEGLEVSKAFLCFNRPSGAC